MKIYFNNIHLEIDVNDNSYRQKSIMGQNTLTLYYSLAQHVEIPIGAWCEFQNERYTLESPENFKKIGSRNFEYTLTMESVGSYLRKIKFLNLVDSRLKFSLTARASEHLAMLVGNLNMRDSGWSVAGCIDSTEKTISYSTTSCDAALQQIADAFNTEWHIEDKSISLGMVEYNKDDSLALPLSYGKGNGFVPGVGRVNFDNSRPIKMLYVQGGSKNISPAYESRELLLPKGGTLNYEGRTYVVDDKGYSIRQQNGDHTSWQEDALDLSHIYPSWEHVVTDVKEEDGNWDIFAQNTSSHPNNLPEDLNYGEYRIEGETVSIVFQTGQLAGKEFDVKQTDKEVTGYVHEERKFMLCSQNIDGLQMPGGNYKPAVGNRFKVFGVSMPNAYIKKAEQEMFQEAAKYLFEHETPRFSFTGELDGIWAKYKWTDISGRIKLGGYVKFSDEHFQKDPVLIRIVGIKDFVNNPYSPQIELSNCISGGSIYSELGKIDKNEVGSEDRHRQAIQFTKRRFRDAKETMKMLEDAFLNFSGPSDPITVQTMQLLVGDESLQFRFVDNIYNPKVVPHNITYNEKAKKLEVESGILQHMTLGINTISSSRKASDFFYWTMAPFEISVSEDPKQSYYLYAKVSKTAQTGVFYCSKEAMKMDGGDDYYFLCGILNSEYGGTRSFAKMYGFTEILPGQITTDRIVSSDGECFFDFTASAFRIGNSGSSFYRPSSLSWNVNNDQKLVLRGTMVQSPAGEESEIACWRGEWVNDTLYYVGDEVTYAGSTYRCIQNYPVVGIMPINTSYWKKTVSKGANGSDGRSTVNVYLYRRSIDGALSVPSQYLSYNLASNQLSGDLEGWSASIPAGEEPLYVTATFVQGSSNVVGIGPESWSEPILYVQNGQNGLNTAAVKLYARAKSAPGPVSEEVTYTFNVALLDPMPEGWSIKEPDNNGEPLWMTGAMAVSMEGSDTIAPTQWSSPVKLVQDGRPGRDGSDGITGNLINDSKKVWYASGAGSVNVWNNPEGYIVEGRTYTLVTSTYAKYNAYSFAVLGASGTQFVMNGGGSWGEDHTDKHTFTATMSGVLQCTVTSSSYTPCVNWVKLVQGSTASLEHEYSLFDLGIKASRTPMFRGDFGAITPCVFYCNDYRQDCVKLGETEYFRYIGADGVTVSRWSNADWEPFGASFESVATNILLSENANLAGFIFSKGVLHSAETVPSDEGPNITMNGATGEATFNNVKLRGHVDAKTGSFGDLRVGVNNDVALVDRQDNQIVSMIKGHIPSRDVLLENNQEVIGRFASIPSGSFCQEVYSSGAVGKLTTPNVVSVSYADTTIAVTGKVLMNTVAENPSTDGSIIEMSVYLKNSSNGRQWLLKTYTCACGVFNNRQNQGKIESPFSTKLHSMPSGNYYIEAEHKLLQQQGPYYINEVRLDSGTITASRVNTTNQSIFGRGAAVVFDANNYLHYGYDKASGGKIGLTYRGPLDMPGILAQYKVLAGGQIPKLTRFGAKIDLTADAKKGASGYETGVYIVPHKIGHVDYTAQVLPIDFNGFYHVTDITSTSITVKFANYANNAMKDAGFMITLTGHN